jgi:hypothetical protein
MKHLRAVALLLAVALSVGSAQESYGSSGKALLFSFSGLSVLNLNSFDGGIGGKYFLNNSTAVRGGLTFGMASQSLPASPGPGQTGTDGSISATRLGVGGALEVHMTSSQVQPYYGAGVGFQYTSTESKNAVIAPAAQTTIKNNRFGETVSGSTYQGGTMLSVYAICGVEYFLNNSISLGAEYRLGFSSTSRSDEEASSGNTTVTTKMGSTTAIGIATGGVLTFAVYI